jgi:hypothetical protein
MWTSRAIWRRASRWSDADGRTGTDARIRWRAIRRRADAPGASRRRGRKGGSGRSGPFRPQRKRNLSVPERPETRLRLLVDIPRRIRTRESWVFTFKTRSLPKAWDHGTALALPVDGRETPIRRRAACPGTGAAVPDGAGPRPRSLTRGTRPCVGGSEGENRNIFRRCQGPAARSVSAERQISDGQNLNSNKSARACLSQLHHVIDRLPVENAEA